MSDFELLEHTSEVGFRATGESIGEAFENAGRATFQIMTDIDELEPVEEVEISVESESLEALLYDFVDELIYISDAENLVLKEFDLVLEAEEGSFRLEGTGRGEKIHADMRRQDVKAPTYSDMDISGNAEWTVTMFLDV